MSAQARRAYEAYARELKIFPGAPGEKWPPWDLLPERIKEGWRAAIVAAVDQPSRTETLTDKQVRLLHESQTATVARKLKEMLPPGQGFILLTFDFGPGASLAYVSNADREDTIRALREWLHKQGAL